MWKGFVDEYREFMPVQSYDNDYAVIEKAIWED